MPPPPNLAALRDVLAPWLGLDGSCKTAAEVLSSRSDRIVYGVRNREATYVVKCSLHHHKAAREFAAESHFSRERLAPAPLTPLLEIGPWRTFASAFVRAAPLDAFKLADSHLVPALAPGLRCLYGMSALPGVTGPAATPLQLLADWCERMPRDANRALATLGSRLLDEIAALEPRFTEGFVHGDMRAANILLVDGRALWIDFEHCRFGDAFFDFAKLFLEPDLAPLRDALATLVFAERLPTNWRVLLELYVQAHRFGIKAWQVRHAHRR